jgi:hypothetical protein
MGTHRGRKSTEFNVPAKLATVLVASFLDNQTITLFNQSINQSHCINQTITLFDDGFIQQDLFACIIVVFMLKTSDKL